jgi:hypothetical protein
MVVCTACAGLSPEVSPEDSELAQQTKLQAQNKAVENVQESNYYPSAEPSLALGSRWDHLVPLPPLLWPSY